MSLGSIDEQLTDARSVGHCNTMGTASTMNAMAEALGMALPGSSSIPAVYRERGACAYETGCRAVDLVLKDIKPSDILTKEAFENAIACCAAIGGSTNAPIHLNAVAKHIGVELNCDDWEGRLPSTIISQYTAGRKMALRGISPSGGSAL